MEIIPCSYRKINSSQLLEDYTTDFSKLRSFYRADPFDGNDIKNVSDALSGASKLKEYIPALKQYHEDLGISDLQADVLNKLSGPGVQVIVTGQQLGLLGGPMYTIYKTLTAIYFARKWSGELDRDIIPVFWLADEDHDFEEINILRLPGREEADVLKLIEDHSEKPVSEIELRGFEDLAGKLKDLLPDTDFSSELNELIGDSYQPGKNHAAAFARFIAKVFEGQGLLIAGSQHQEIKKLLKDAFSISIEQREEINQSLESQSNKLDKLYHQQVQLGSTNLFYIDDSGKRVKINAENNSYVIEGTGTFTEEEILRKIEDQSHRFSPNVFLRPVIQDLLLPTLAYVAGPGELAYYGQMKTYYNIYGLEMPLILPRFSFTLLETAIQKSLNNLPFEIGDYDKREEDLIAQYIEQSQDVDLNAFMEEWVSTVNESSADYLKKIEELDASLRASAEKTLAVFKTETDKLKGKLFRSQKQQEETQINRIRKVQSNIYPDGILQERSVSPVYFMNKYGSDIWDRILLLIDDQDLQTDKHYLLNL